MFQLSNSAFDIRIMSASVYMSSNATFRLYCVIIFEPSNCQQRQNHKVHLHRRHQLWNNLTVISAGAHEHNGVVTSHCLTKARSISLSNNVDLVKILQLQHVSRDISICGNQMHQNSHTYKWSKIALLSRNLVLNHQKRIGVAIICMLDQKT